jgi:hypothetical protein
MTAQQKAVVPQVSAMAPHTIARLSAAANSAPCSKHGKGGNNQASDQETNDVFSHAWPRSPEGAALSVGLRAL